MSHAVKRKTDKGRPGEKRQPKLTPYFNRLRGVDVCYAGVGVTQEHFFVPAEPAG